MPSSDDLAINQFKAEGAFILSADNAASKLRNRLAASPVVMPTLDEMHALSEAFTRITAIAWDYHLGAAECGR
jgi:hypothetical protein